MYRMFTAVALAALSTFAAGSASAGSVSFQFGCGSVTTDAGTANVACDRSSGSAANIASLPNAFSQTVSGLTVTASAGYFAEGSLWYLPSTNTITAASLSQNAAIGRFGGGAGVFSGRGDTHTVDGANNNDVILLSFSQSVTMDQFRFGFFDARDNFRYVYDVNGDGTIGAGDFLSDDNRVASAFNGITDASSRLWGVAAFDRNDSWKLNGVTVGTADVAPVPLPAAGLLLLAGVGGLFGLRRRKTA